MNVLLRRFALVIVAALALPTIAQEATGPALSPSGEKARVAVFGFANKTKNEAYDAAAASATGSLFLTLRGLNAYDVIPPDEVARTAPSGTSDAELAAWCDENRADYALYGSMENKKNGNLICRLSSFSRMSQKTTVSRSENDVSLFGVFEASDTLIASVLESVTGAHIGFGAIAFAKQGEGSYTVALDGVSVGENCFGIDRVVAGSHRVVVTQRIGGKDRTALDAPVSVREGEATEVSIPLIGGEKASAVTMGRFYLCWLPGDAEVSVDGSLMENASAEGSSIYRSRFLAPGEHSVTISGKYGREESVTIVAGTDVELKGYTSWMLGELKTEHDGLAHRAHMKRLRQTAATVIMAGALAAAGVSVMAYKLGRDAGDDYDSATDPAAAADARKDVERYGYIFPAAVGTAGVLGITSVSLYLSSTGAGKLEKASRQINDQIRGIKKVQKQMEKGESNE